MIVVSNGSIKISEMEQKMDRYKLYYRKTNRHKWMFYGSATNPNDMTRQLYLCQLDCPDWQHGLEIDRNVSPSVNVATLHRPNDPKNIERLYLITDKEMAEAITDYINNQSLSMLPGLLYTLRALHLRD